MEIFAYWLSLCISPRRIHDKGVATDRNTLQILRNMFEGIDLQVSTADPMPENWTPAALDLLNPPVPPWMTCCSTVPGRLHPWGGVGGSSTASKPRTDYSPRMARKTRADGRPGEQG